MLLLCILVCDQVRSCWEEVACLGTGSQPLVADDHAPSREAAQELDRAPNLVSDQVSAMVDRVDEFSSQVPHSLLSLPVDHSREHDARLVLLRGRGDEVGGGR